MRNEQLPALTGLRFIAAFAIVWLHADLYFGWASSGRGYPLMLGVSFFFVLSGFILTHAYQSRNVSYLGFVGGRFARLWPLHIVCIVSVMLFVQPDSQYFDGPGIYSKWASLGINFALLQSWIPTTSYMFSWNSVSWSISTEMFFYAMFPVLLPLLKRSAFLVLAVGALPIIALATLIPFLQIPMSGDVFDVTGDALLYSFPPARLLEFCVGMAAYKAWSKMRPRMPSSIGACTVLELSGFAVFALWFTQGGQFVAAATNSVVLLRWYGTSAACFAFAVIIIVMASSKGIIGRMLSTWPMVKLGEISFALYMTHQIVMKVIGITHPHLGSAWIVLPAVFAAAIFGHYAIEKPGQRILMGLRRSPHVPVAAAA